MPASTFYHKNVIIYCHWNTLKLFFKVPNYYLTSSRNKIGTFNHTMQFANPPWRINCTSLHFEPNSIRHIPLLHFCAVNYIIFFLAQQVLNFYLFVHSIQLYNQQLFLVMYTVAYKMNYSFNYSTVYNSAMNSSSDMRNKRYTNE